MLVVEFVGVAVDAPGSSCVVVDRDGVGVVIVMAGILLWFATVSRVVNDMINLGLLAVVHHGGQTRGSCCIFLFIEYPVTSCDINRRVVLRVCPFSYIIYVGSSLSSCWSGFVDSEVAPIRERSIGGIVVSGCERFNGSLGTVQQKEIFGQNLDRQVMDSWIWVFVGEQDNQTLVMAKLINLTINMAMLQRRALVQCLNQVSA